MYASQSPTTASYDLTLFTAGKGPRSYDGVHGEMLQDVFGSNTGLVGDLRASA